MSMIIDSHTHVGEPSRPSPLTYRTEMPYVYMALAVPEGATGTVVVETKSGVEEVEWGLCTKRWNAEAWFDRLTTNGAINQPFALSLSKGNSHDPATSCAKPRVGAGRALLEERQRRLQVHRAVTGRRRASPSLHARPTLPKLMRHALSQRFRLALQ